MRADLLSRAQKGGVSEYAVDSLTLLTTCGDLHLAQPLPDDAGIDRVLFRPGLPRSAALQLKSAMALVRGRYLHFRVHAPRFSSGSREGYYIFGCHLVPHSPWIDREFFFIPATALPAVPPNGAWNIRVPLHTRRKSKYDRFRHPLTDLGTVLSSALDGGPAYPFPPPREQLRKLSSTATGRLFENELACLATFGSDGALHVWRPMVDLGEDLGVTDDAQAASLRVQVKGCLGLDFRGRVHAYIHERTFRESRFNLVVILWYLVEELRLADYGWVFRTDELADLSLHRRPDGQLEFIAPPTPRSRNQFRPWLYRVEEIPGVLQTALAYIREEGPAAVLPTRRAEVADARRRLRLR